MEDHGNGAWRQCLVAATFGPVDDFVRSCHEGTQPPNHVWNAAAYTVPGIVAHQSALRGGELLEIPHLGALPD